MNSIISPYLARAVWQIGGGNDLRSGTFALLFLMAILLVVFSASFADASGVQDYTYVKSTTITGSPDGDLQNYPVKFIVHSGDGTDSGANVYLNGHAQSWPDDMRFTNNADVILSYWIESSDVDSATVWVNADRIPASPGTAAIKLYYGMADDPGASSASSTFPLFDDFKGSSLNTDIWSPIIDPPANVIQQNGELDFIGGGSDPYRPLVRSNAQFGRGIMVTATEKCYSRDAIAGIVIEWDGNTGGRWSAPADSYAFEYSPPAGVSCILKAIDGVQTTVSNRSMYGDTSWHTIDFGIDDSGNFRSWIDGMPAVSGTDNTYARGYVGLYGREQPYYVKEGFRIVYVRNWTPNEPSHGTWGTETTVHAPAFPWIPVIIIVSLLLFTVALLLALGALIIYTLGKRRN